MGFFSQIRYDGGMDKETLQAAEHFSSLVNHHIRDLMSMRGISSLRDLEARTGINKDRLSRTLNKGMMPLNLLELDRISTALGVESSEILRRAEVTLARELATTPSPPLSKD